MTVEGWTTTLYPSWPAVREQQTPTVVPLLHPFELFPTDSISNRLFLKIRVRPPRVISSHPVFIFFLTVPSFCVLHLPLVDVFKNVLYSVCIKWWFFIKHFTSSSRPLFCVFDSSSELLCSRCVKHVFGGLFLRLDHRKLLLLFGIGFVFVFSGSKRVRFIVMRRL